MEHDACGNLLVSKRIEKDSRDPFQQYQKRLHKRRDTFLEEFYKQKDMKAGVIESKRVRGQKVRAKPTAPEKRRTTIAHVQNDICLAPHWVQHTRFLRCLKIYDLIFSKNPDLNSQCSGEEGEAMFQACMSRCEMFDLNVFNFFREQRGRQKKDLALSALLLLKYGSTNTAVGVMARVQDRAGRCRSAKKQAYVLMVQYGVDVLEHNDTKVGETWWDRYIRNDFKSLLAREKRLVVPSCVMSPAGERLEAKDTADFVDRKEGADALRFIHRCIEDYLDSHKMNAFLSAFQEPARFYYHLCGNSHHRDHVNVHGLNGYLCMISGGLGMNLPMVPYKDDKDAYKGCTDHWRGLRENAWEVFSKPSNFGKTFEGIPELKKAQATTYVRSERQSAYHYRFAKPVASALAERAKKGERSILQHLDRFVHFFRREFLVKRLFEVLNSENKPEYHGFRKACNKLFPLYAHDKYISATGGITEYLYDEYFTTLDIDRTADFLAWLGVLKESEGQQETIRVHGGEEQSRQNQQCGAFFGCLRTGGWNGGWSKFVDW
eukprot:CAMPEP_0167753314 /NCGR_PEP_ID=MMETSP0110_2-20121227/7640_1 /TAXON_ID=629695 /ORGANISM="Gymnochlora sp., Strain CCMP2014" /LENGTH=546 /DNA_ID=CAMNT_0007639057 /DNA_START=163 /DNA_END=1800 /DNA_ORIENTATION=-